MIDRAAAGIRMVPAWVGLHRTIARCVLGDGGVPLPALPRSERLPLLIFSQVAWDDVWQRPQEMARGLARHRPVVFCAPVQVHQALGPLAGRWSPVRTELGGRLLILSPAILSGEYRSGAVRAANRVIVARLLAELVGRRPFAFLSNSPFADWLVPELKPSVVAYDAIDDFCAFEWAPRDGRARERRLLLRADPAFAGTHALERKHRRVAPRIEFLASGVDFDKMTAPAPEPAELRGLPRPRLLYVGTLNDRTSGELVAATARAFPQASIVLVGPRRATFGNHQFPANVRELGLKPHDELPGFYQHCDLALMPFADNAAARAINPVKTLEYLACGLATISTPIPDVRRFYEPPVVVAKPDAWPREIERMLAEDTAEQRAQRTDFARGRSWNALVEKMEARIREAEEKAKDEG